MFTYADNAIAGLFLGVGGLGIYSLGFNIATILPSFLVAGLGDVAYATFCRMQNKVGEIASNLTQLQKLTATILFPIAFGLSAVAPTFVQLLYGEKWTGLGMVLSLLVIMPGLSSLWMLNATAYQAIGRPDIYTKISGFSLLVMIPLLWIAAPHGLLIFTLTRFAVAWLLPLGNLLWGSRVLNIDIRKQINVIACPLLISGGMYVMVVGLITYLRPFEGWMGWTKFVAVIWFGGAAYIIALRLITPDLWHTVFLNVKRAVLR
jgi:O-antigen/teichoic acid export membrane protein